MSKANYYRELPRKRMASGVLFFDEEMRVLLVQPTYKEHWEIPGGVIEENESPISAAVREVREELSLDIAEGQLALASLDYMGGSMKKTEALMFVFAGGVLTDDRIARIRVDPKELKGFEFVKICEVERRLGPTLGSRVRRAIEAANTGKVHYFEGTY